MMSDGWALKSLAEIADIVTGKTPSSVEPAFWGGSLPFITPADLGESYYVQSSKRQLSEKGASVCHLIPQGSVLVTCIGSIGKMALTRCVCAINQQINAIIPNAGYCPEFVYYALQANASTLRRLTGTSVVPIVPKSQLSLLRLPFPSISEQRSIVAVLSTWNRAIEQIERLIEAKRLLNKSLLKRLLSVRQRMKYGAREKDGTEWRLAALGDLFNHVQRKNHGESTRILTASGHLGLVDQRDFFSKTIAGQDLQGYWLIKRGEYAYNRSSMTGYPFGAIKRLDKYEEGLLSTLYICLVPRDGRICSDFYKHYFDSGLLEPQLRTVAKLGARVHGLLNVTVNEFLRLKVPYPPLDEQQHIARTINSVEREMSLLQEKLRLLKAQEQGLVREIFADKSV